MRQGEHASPFTQHGLCDSRVEGHWENTLPQISLAPSPLQQRLSTYSIQTLPKVINNIGVQAYGFLQPFIPLAGFSVSGSYGSFSGFMGTLTVCLDSCAVSMNCFVRRLRSTGCSTPNDWVFNTLCFCKYSRTANFPYIVTGLLFLRAKRWRAGSSFLDTWKDKIGFLFAGNVS